jgi:DNA polymerase I-like protein with 3'-5' exonuclease and polymerase domains
LLHGNGRHSNSTQQQQQLALLQLFVPAVAADQQDNGTRTAGAATNGAAAAAGPSNQQQQQQEQPGQSWQATIYIVEVPELQPEAAHLLALLQPVLQDAGVVKVMHDTRKDSCILQQQFGVRLDHVLDTQLLAGLAAMAGSTAAGSAAAACDNAHQAGPPAAAGGSSSSDWDGYLGRVGLERLYEAYGFAHPLKEPMQLACDANPR